MLFPAYRVADQSHVLVQELDTTLQVLGIDGDVQKPLAPVRITTSVHAPLVDETPLAPRRTASIASSSVFFSPRAGFGRTPSDAAFRLRPCPFPHRPPLC